MKNTSALYRFTLWLMFSCFCGSAFSQSNSPVIDFASDTQEPLWIEKILLTSNRNADATRMIFQDINLRHPSALFILGDVVALGFEDSKWKKIDEYLKLLKATGVPVYAALGNHELMFRAVKGGRKFQKRFPMHSATGYLEIVDSVAVILLNSNFAKMKPVEIQIQDTWYKNTLSQLETDPGVKSVLVGCHHSPYTNSTIVAPSLLVREKFVAPFLKSDKCVLFLSGHSHNFEHFKVDGKQFLVIGGGGGIHQPVYSGIGRLRTNDINSDYKPMFHYLEIRRVRDSLQVTSRQLKSDFSGFTDGLTFKF